MRSRRKPKETGREIEPPKVIAAPTSSPHTTPVNAVPFPSGDLDEPLEKILVYIISPNTDRMSYDVAKHLNVHPQRALLYLTDLVRGGYIKKLRDPYGLTEHYGITDKGRRYLADKNLI